MHTNFDQFRYLISFFVCVHMAMFVSRELVREKLAVCLFEESVAFVRINMCAIHKKRMHATYKNTHILSISIRIHIYER